MSSVISRNPYIAQALSFARDTATHTYSRKLTHRVLRGRERAVAIHVFTPRQAPPRTPALALLSGGALTPNANFYALAPNLMTSNPHRVLVFPDTPGTGDSGREVRDLKHLDYARLYLHGLRDALGETPCVLGGHSQGGGYAQTIARLNDELPGTDPDRISITGLLLLDPVPLEGARYMLLRFARYRTTAQVVQHIVCTPAASTQMVDFFRWALRAEKALSPRATWANMRGQDFPDATHPFSGPVLILGAEESGTVKQDRLRRMEASAAYPQAVYRLVRSAPGEPAGHLDYLAYQRTTDMITEFLEDRGNAPST